ncbi:MAG: type II toxin-antitoxin system RelE/ParE family toxin [Candidatus Wildermuthbacteria bacterium]|nr:type II toxin-antitoxin system RelE/ParE family toxin [Candidatus Wildermuthbacteria bacterium]
MERYRIVIAGPAGRNLKKIPLPWRMRIQRALDEICEDPYHGQKMKGHLSDRRKIKVWPYRILYRILELDKVVEVVEIGHRGSMEY